MPESAAASAPDAHDDRLGSHVRRDRRRHQICIELRIRTVHQPLWTWWERRLDLLMPGDWRRSLFMAAIFPKVAALAAVLRGGDREAVIR